MSGTAPHNLPRNGTADLLKGVAVILMIQVHIMEQFAAPDLQRSILGQISLLLGGPFCAPVFLAVMGFYLVSAGRPFSHYLRRGVLLFAGGIALNIARSANLLQGVYSGSVNLDPLPFIFGADILTLAGISIVIVAFLRLLFGSNPYLWAVSILPVAIIAPLLPADVGQDSWLKYLYAFVGGVYEWSYFPIFPWLGYVLLGYTFRLLLTRSEWLRGATTQTLLIYMIPIGIGLVASFPWAMGVSCDLNGVQGYYHHGLLFFLWTTGFLMIYIAAVRLAETSYGSLPAMKLIKMSGRRVTLGYVVQWLVIGNMATLLYGSQSLLQVVLWTSAVTVLVFAAGWIRELKFSGKN